MASLGLIGAIGGVGGEMVKQADREVEMGAKRDFEKWRLEVMQAYKIGDEQRAEARTIDAEKRGLVSRAQERKNIVDETVENAPRLREVKVGDRKAEKLAEYDSEVTGARLDAEAQSARKKAEIEREETVKTGSDPAYLAAKRKLTQAGHVEGLGSVAQAALANLKIEELKKVNSLIEEFETTADPKRKAVIKESLTVRGIIKPGEYDTEEVTTTGYDAEGNEVKTARKQKRRPESKAPAAPPAGAKPWEKYGRTSS